MFQSDDWDIEEDYMREFMDDDIFDKSKKPTDDVPLNIKRRKVDDDTNQFSNIEAVENKNEYVQDCQSTQRFSINKLNRRNNMLKILESNSTVIKEPLQTHTSTEENQKHGKCQSLCNNIDLQQRRNRALEILKGNNVEKEENFENLTRPQFNIDCKPSNKGEVIISENNKSIISNAICNSNFIKKKNTEASNSCRENNNQNCFKESKSKEHNNSIDSNIRPVLVRRFPGPAGLLPDEPDPSIPMSTYMKCIYESDKKKSDNLNESKISDYCSQNTKKQFTTGAWQLMLNDLPLNFLKGYEISAIKENANSDIYKKKKVEFLAGVIQCIDYKQNNPRITLKDISDEIEGLLHCEILNLYPKVLDCGIVMLLRNVGLVKSKSNFYAMISPKNIVSIYSDKSRIVSTPHIESINSGFNTSHLNQHFNNVFGDSFEEKNSNLKVKTLIKTSTEIFENSLENRNEIFVERSKKSIEPKQIVSQIIVKNIEDSDFDSLFDLEDDEAFFNIDDAICGNEESNFFKSPCNANKIVTSMNCIVEEEQKGKENVQNIKLDSKASLMKYTFNKTKSREMQITNNSTLKPSSTSLLTSLIKTSSQNSLSQINNVLKNSDDKSTRSQNYLEVENCNTNNKKVAPSTRESSFKMKLQKFRKNNDDDEDVSTNVSSSKISSAKSTSECSAGFVNDLFGTSNDLDDEILSQLDIDFIVEKHS